MILTKSKARLPIFLLLSAWYKAQKARNRGGITKCIILERPQQTHGRIILLVADINIMRLVVSSFWSVRVEEANWGP